MNQQSSLEKQIGGLIATYADQAPTRVDGARVARLVASRHPARRGLLGLSLGGPLTAAIALLLVALMAAAIPIGAQLLRRPATVVTPDATANPSAAPAESSSAPPPNAGLDPYLGMPPAGAQPTGATDGTLLVAFHARFADLAVMQYWLWLFADGRLIWLSEGGNHGHAPRGALVVQHLSPAGVEALRSWVAANSSPIDGLVTEAGVQFTGGPGVIWGGLTLAVDDQRTVATWDVEPTLPRRLVDPGAWLPASAWDDATVRGYVPSRYAVCTWVDGNEVDPALAVDGFLPTDLISTVRAGEVTTTLTSGPPICRTVDLDAARAIVAALPADRIESAGTVGPRFNLVRTVLPSLGSPVGEAQQVTLDVSPMVPSGDIVCNCG